MIACLWVFVFLFAWCFTGFVSLVTIIYVEDGEAKVKDVLNEEVVPVIILGPIVVFIAIFCVIASFADYLKENCGEADLSWMVRIPIFLFKAPFLVLLWPFRRKKKDKEDESDVDQETD